MWTYQMSLEEYLELRREAKNSGWNVDALEMFLTAFHFCNSRDATLAEVREFFQHNSKEDAAE